MSHHLRRLPRPKRIAAPARTCANPGGGGGHAAANREHGWHDGGGGGHGGHWLDDRV